MEKVANVFFSEMKNSKYILPYRLHYNQNGKQRTYDVIQNHATVSVIIFNISGNVLIFVKPFRPTVFVNHTVKSHITYGDSIDTDTYHPNIGVTLELCAGLVDKKGLNPKETIKEEILEEVGYNVSLEKIEKIISYIPCISNCGITEYVCYCEVKDEDKVSAGGGLEEEGEMIEIVEMSTIDAKQYIQKEDVQSEAALIIGLNWFFANKLWMTRK